MSEEVRLPHEETILQYLRKGIERTGLTQEEVGEVLDLDQSAVSRLLTGVSRLRYKEAYDVLLLILKHISSLPIEPASKHHTPFENVEAVYSDETILEAAKKMKNGDFTQLPVFERQTEKCLGIVTDWALLMRMLNPIKAKSKETWLKDMRNMRIKDAEVIDEVPKYPSESPLIEVAEGLMHHYAVLTEEEMGKKIGIITRADFLKLLIRE